MEEEIIVKDCNGNILKEGDSVMVIKDLKIKGMSNILKRGAIIKNIKRTDNAEEIECKVGKSVVVLKTCFLKKS